LPSHPSTHYLTLTRIAQSVWWWSARCTLAHQALLENAALELKEYAERCLATAARAYPEPATVAGQAAPEDVDSDAENEGVLNGASSGMASKESSDQIEGSGSDETASAAASESSSSSSSPSSSSSTETASSSSSSSSATTASTVDRATSERRMARACRLLLSLQVLIESAHADHTFWNYRRQLQTLGRAQRLRCGC
jgi:hypothetical protein